MAKRWHLLTAIFAIVALLSACQPVQAPDAAGGEPEATEAAAVETTIPVVTLTVSDGRLEAPAEIPSGIVAVTVQGGDPENMPELAKLNDGVTMVQVNEALAQPDPMAALPLVTLLGSTGNSVDGQVIYDLTPGDYVAVYFPAEGPPQSTAISAGEPSGATAPVADVNVALVDFNFAMPDTISAGPHVWQIDNMGGQWHEMPILKLNEGVTVDDLIAMMAEAGPGGPEGPPPFEMVAFWSPMSAGQRALVTFDLPPGEYTVLCFLPDLNGDMSPHLAHGMVRTLTVE